VAIASSPIRAASAWKRGGEARWRGAIEIDERMATPTRDLAVAIDRKLMLGPCGVGDGVICASISLAPSRSRWSITTCRGRSTRSRRLLHSG